MECATPTGQSPKSQNIPISKPVLRTASEAQLCLDEQIADQRDYVFYSRLVKGISRTQTKSHDMCLRMENHRCLAHITQTRLEGQQLNDDWAFNLHYSENVDKDFFTAITADALALASSPVEEGIFELDL